MTSTAIPPSRDCSVEPKTGVARCIGLPPVQTSFLLRNSYQICARRGLLQRAGFDGDHSRGVEVFLDGSVDLLQGEGADFAGEFVEP